MREDDAVMLADDLLVGVTDMCVEFGSTKRSNEMKGKAVTIHRRVYERAE